MTPLRKPSGKKFPGEAFKESIKESLHEALNEVWPEVINEFKKDIYCQLWGYDGCEFYIVDGCNGEDFYKIKLSKLVEQYISDKDGSCGVEEEIKWCNNLAKDLEKQADRPRKHSIVLSNTFAGK